MPRQLGRPTPRALRLQEPLLVAGFLGLAWIVLSPGLDLAASFDEGVYLASLDALRHGQRLGADVFASQPPGFYVLLQLSAFVFGDSIADVRLGMLVVALIGCLGAYVLGRVLAGPAAGLLAASLLLLAPSFYGDAARAAADVPSASLAIAAVGLAAAAWSRDAGTRRHGRAACALLSGLALAAACSVKLDALTTLPALIVLAIVTRPPRRLLAAAVLGAGALSAALTGAYAGVLDDLWGGVVGLHLDARKLGSGGAAGAHDLLGKVEVIGREVDPRAFTTWLMVGGALAGLVMLRRHRLPRSVSPLWAWAGVAAAFLLWQQPLFDHHVVLLSAILAVAVGVTVKHALELKGSDRIRTGGRLVVAGLCVAGVAQAAVLLRGQPGERLDFIRAAVLLQRRTTPSTRALADWPIIAFYADRRIPGQLVDPSFVRFVVGSLTTEDVLDAVDQGDVTAVVAGRAFLVQRGIAAGLEKRFEQKERVGEVVLYSSPTRSR